VIFSALCSSSLSVLILSNFSSSFVRGGNVALYCTYRTYIPYCLVDCYMSVRFHERRLLVLRPYVLLHDRTTISCIISNMKMIVQFHIFRPKFSHQKSLFVNKLRTTIVKLNSVLRKQFLVSTSLSPYRILNPDTASSATSFLRHIDISVVFVASYPS
jgi:hypothetical protein